MNCGACGDPSICRDHGCQQEAWELYQEQQRQPTYEEQCAAGGHPYYGEDRNLRAELPCYPRDWHRTLLHDGGTCYCGARRYPVGGPIILPEGWNAPGWRPRERTAA